MKGIYKFQNKINQKIYIGQSVNIEERYKSHKRNYNNLKKDTLFYRAIRKYGWKNFTFETIIENDNFTKEDLNILEIYYINYYDSYNKGYNMNKGGNFTSSDKKINEKIASDIKNDIKNSQLNFDEIANKYKVSNSLISMINCGRIWITDENYPLRKQAWARKGELNGKAKITDFEVMELRKMYVNISLTEIFNNFNLHNLSFSEMKKIIYGVQFKHLPVYKKREKIWKLNGTCIDYAWGWNTGQ